jgi:hypothetical protein
MVFQEKHVLSVGEQINSIDHNCGKEKVAQDVQGLHMYTVISNPEFSQWQNFLCSLVREGPFKLINQHREIVVMISLAES